MSNKSKILVIIQFSCFAFFAITGDIFTFDYWLILQFIGLLLGLWGILAMKIGNFNIQPEVKSDAIMTSKGPYVIIRNPMYSGIILFFGTSIFVNFNFDKLLFSVIRLVVFLILLIVLLLKIHMEENFLKARFNDDYIKYKNKTFRLIPYIY